jgi:hypothetical protein
MRFFSSLLGALGFGRLLLLLLVQIGNRDQKRSLQFLDVGIVRRKLFAPLQPPEGALQNRHHGEHRRHSNN